MTDNRLHMDNFIPHPLVKLDLSVEQIAKVAHDVNKAYCEALGDHSQRPWDEAPDWQRDSARSGVEFHLANPNASAEASHSKWMLEKLADGWFYGKVKDEEAKTHPCMVSFHSLPREQQAKDFIFRQVVRSLSESGIK